MSDNTELSVPPVRRSPLHWQNTVGAVRSLTAEYRACEQSKARPDAEAEAVFVIGKDGGLFD